MDLTMQIDQILAQRKLSTDSCKQLVVNSQLTTDKLLTDKEINTILDIVSDLINPKFKAWYISRLFKLGPSEFIARADKARKYGKVPSVYFSSILKK